MDTATIIGYGAGYLAAVVAVLLLYLPFLVSFGLLLLLAGALRLVIFLLTAMALGAYRGLVRLFKTATGRLPHGRGGRRLLQH